jgi:ribosomal protein S27AE
VRGSKSLLVEHQCPQCGGPVTLQETDRLFSCGFCRVRLYITSPGRLRYCLPPTAPSAEDIAYIPYWRFRGMSFSLRPYEIRNRVLDTSYLASPQDFMPHTLGVRAQAMKLRFAFPEMKAAFLSSATPLEDVVARAEKMSVAASPGKVFHRAFIGETVSIIYSPVYVRGRGIYDAVLNRPVAKYTLLRADGFGSVDRGRGWQVRFLPALCPNCGWDLAGERDSMVLLCGNCDSAWRVSKGSLARQDFAIVPESGKGVVYLPFWRLRARVDGLDVASYADLLRLANLPRAAQPGLQKKALHFWSPAFKLHPKVYLRLAMQVTTGNPEDGFKTTLSGASHYPVTVDSTEAAEAARVTLAALSVAKKKVFPIIPEVDIKV